MLILVAVTINVTLNGGIISKAKSASSQTEVSIIQETLMLEKMSKIAGNNGNAISDYGITLNSLDISQNLKDKYSSKLTISKDGTLYYKDGVSSEDAALFESMGITKETGEEEEIPSEDTPVTSPVWESRGVTNAIIAKMYTDKNDVYEFKFNQDGGLHAIMGQEYNLTKEEVDGIITKNGANDFTLDVNETPLRITVAENGAINAYIEATPTVLKVDWADDLVEYGKVYKMEESDENGTERISLAFVKERGIVIWEMYMSMPSFDMEDLKIGVSPYTYDKINNKFIFGDDGEYAICGENKVTASIGEINDIDLDLTDQTASNFYTAVVLPTNIVKTDINLKNGIYNYGNSYISMDLSMINENKFYTYININELWGTDTVGDCTHDTKQDALNFMENEKGITLIEGTNDAFMKDGNRYTLMTSLD